MTRDLVLCCTSRLRSIDSMRFWRCHLLGLSGCGVGLIAIPLAPTVAHGPLSAHMIGHIALMNAVAPAVASAFFLRRRSGEVGSLELAAASVAQIAMLWMWHAPPAFDAAMSNRAFHVLAWASLLSSAVWFWSLVFSETSGARWRAIMAVLLTGKLFCLLGVLLIFAPRPLYSCFSSMCSSGDAMLLEDQQLAGLLMVAACPLTFVTAGIVMASRGLTALSRGTPVPPVQRTDIGLVSEG